MRTPRLASLLAALLFVSACAGTSVGSASQSPQPPKTALTAVTCPSVTRCIAVGYAYQLSDNAFQTLIEERTDHGWSVVPSQNDSTDHSDRLDGVACASVDWCVAVGSIYGGCIRSPCIGFDQGLIEENTGDGWHIAASVEVPCESDLSACGAALNAVTCPTKTQCIAVGGRGNALDHALIVTVSRDGFEIVPAANGGCSSAGCPSELTGVACAAQLRCIAIGSTYQPTALIEENHGAGWMLDAGPTPPFATEANLAGIACASTTQCIAVGTDPATNQALMAQTSSGGWNAVAVPGTGLASVACSSPTFCVAVGPGEALEGGPASWTSVFDPPHLAVPRCEQSSGCRPDLEGVYCDPDRCFAVGTFTSLNRAGEALIEERDGSGRWTLVVPR